MGYLRYPTISGDLIAFTSEDDLWSVPADGGRAWRLTAGVADVARPVLSPDGEWIAFAGTDEGPAEVYVMPADGGETTRLTFGGLDCDVTGWTPDGSRIIYASSAGRPHRRETMLATIPRDGGPIERLALGHATSLSYGPGESGAVVLSRSQTEPAHWKRYRGGRARNLWVDPTGSGDFRPLIDVDGNFADPCWVGDRIFFLSDHEGFGNVYSCTPDGRDLRRHTDHETFYARHLSSDGRRLVYQCAGELWLLDPAEHDPRRVPVELGSSRVQRNRQFVSAMDYLDSVRLGPDGSDLAITTRGKAFTFAHWEGPVRQHGAPDAVRYRLATWLHGHDRLIAAMGDSAPDERLVVLTADGSSTPQVLDGLDIGLVGELRPAPKSDVVAYTNHRNEVGVVDLTGETPTARVLDTARHDQISGVTWSPDGRWLAYSKALTPTRYAIVLCDVESGEVAQATDPVLRDHAPSFDPDGKHLYFLGQRELNPVYDALQFELGFPLGTRPYLVTLRKDVPDPFVLQPKPVNGAPAKPNGDKKAGESDTEKDDEKKDEGDKKADGADDAAPALEIDLDGITERVLAFPVPEGRYRQIAGISGKVLFSLVPVEPAGDWRPSNGSEAGKAILQCFDFETGRAETLADGLNAFQLDPGRKTLLYRSGPRIRVIKAGEKPSDENGEYSRKTGWVDFDRVKVSVRPGAEWHQMFREAWRLQREFYWDAGLAGIDWDELYDRYLPLVDRIASRAEFSDLMWELQGELGTSHAYEFGGAYRPRPNYQQGILAVDWAYDEETGQYGIENIAGGDRWDTSATSPLNRQGIDVRPGDVVLAINRQPIGRTAERHVQPGEPLVGQADQEVELTIRRGDEGAAEPRTVVVKAIGDDRDARYRDWVNANRAYVHERTEGRVGYLHIPNMMGPGFGEFHRGFLQEYDREALIIDVRYNGGGHVSGLLMEKVARRRIAHTHSRWTEPSEYPDASPRGPMVALTNEYAGSDGDIFSHTFKMHRLGPLIGKRTWGGVVGISPRHALADGAVTTQPEHAFRFDDVGWQVENYGTDPDIEVDFTPQDYAKGVDPQLEKALEVVVEVLATNPPDVTPPPPRRTLAPQKLPPRP